MGTVGVGTLNLVIDGLLQPTLLPQENKMRRLPVVPALPTKWLAMFTTSLVNKSREPLADRNESPGSCLAQLGVITRVCGQSGRCSGRR